MVWSTSFDVTNGMVDETDDFGEVVQCAAVVVQRTCMPTVTAVRVPTTRGSFEKISRFRWWIAALASGRGRVRYMRR